VSYVGSNTTVLTHVWWAWPAWYGAHASRISGRWLAKRLYLHDQRPWNRYQSL